jgi:hypothetical protein
MLLIDKITNISLANGILRIECAHVDATGKEAVSDLVVIPANRVGEVLGQLNKSVQQLQQRLQKAGQKQAN